MGTNETKERLIARHKELLMSNARYKVLMGGRGSGKSWLIAQCLLELSLLGKLRILCAREVQNSIRDSVWRLLVDTIDRKGWNKQFDVTYDSIRAIPTGSTFLFKGLRLNPSIKSTEGIDLCWCFVAGTKIDGRPIETIKVGDYVRSFNHDTQRIEYQRVVRVMKNPAPNRLYKLSLVGSKEHIISTGEHPYFVKGKGYIPVSDIIPGDIVYACKTEYSRICSLSRRLRGNDCNGYSRKTSKVRKTRWGILQRLCSQTSIGKDEEKQPYEQSGKQEKSRKNTKAKRKSSLCLGRKWARINKRTKTSSFLARKRLVAGVGCSYRDERSRCTDQLQDRYCEYLAGYCYRSGRWKSSRANFSSRGCSQRYILEEQRVASVEIQEQGSIARDGSGERENFVFNLEVERNHNYFAGNVLVHNCEEAQLISEESWRVLIPTIRKEQSQFWISFNPDTADDPVWKRFVAHDRPDVLKHTVNWYDNPYFPDVLKEEKDWHYKVDPNGAANVWGGELRQNTAASIFAGHYTVEPIPDDIHKRAQGVYLGADFGFSQDPSTLVRCVIKDRTLYITHEAWGLHVKNSKLKELYSCVPDYDKLEIIADSARPETIDYLTGDCGLFMKPCTKYAGSVEDGIAKIKAFENVVIDPRCVHAAEEFRLYSYKVDKLTGNITNKIEDRWNHVIDAIRYAIDDVVSLNGGLSVWANLA